MKEITQKGKTLRMMMHEHAEIKTDKIPELVKKYGGRMTFTAVGRNPVFSYNMAMNSRDAKKADVLGLLGEITEAMEEICL